MNENTMAKEQIKVKRDCHFIAYLFQLLQRTGQRLTILPRPWSTLCMVIIFLSLYARNSATTRRIDQSHA